MRLLLAPLVVLALLACGSVPGGGKALTVDELKFRVFDVAGQPSFCDPDFYPIAREGGEQASADATYQQIRADSELYAAIVEHEHLPSGELDEAQKLTLYRAYKKLRVLSLTPSGSSYSFNYRAVDTSGSYWVVAGTVSEDGSVTVASKTPSGPPPCPICLSAATRIATPSGEVLVTAIRVGTLVWTETRDGKRIAVPVIEVGSAPVPTSHLMVHLRLADGRELWASPGHRTADGRQLGSLAAGDVVDGSTITAWELVPYGHDRTYDLLPAGPTGTYWANDILLESTLAAPPGASSPGLPEN